MDLPKGPSLMFINFDDTIVYYFKIIYLYIIGMMPGLYIYDGSCTFRKDNNPKVRK